MLPGKIITKPQMKRFHVNRQDMFDNVMGNCDFTKCKNSLEAVTVMFNQLFPIIEQVTTDNEILLEDQAKQMKQFAELDEKYKLMEKEYEQYKKENPPGESLREEIDGSLEEGIQGDLFIQKGSGKP
jgi:hypothetical protein